MLIILLVFLALKQIHKYIVLFFEEKTRNAKLLFIEKVLKRKIGAVWRKV